MKLITLPIFGALCGAFGCAPWYEEVPAFGQTDPTYANIQQPQQQPQVVANQAQAQTEQGQPVGQVDDEYSDTDPSALSDFKQTLDPYGTWADDSTYGTVWQPDPTVVGADFEPYVTNGYWGYDNDYVWVSDWDWGWAPFHYGRWTYITGRGWCWIPGRRYAGAWVGWRVGPAGYGYVGWGPLAPTWGWRNGAAFGYGFQTQTPYSFVATGDLFSRSLHDRVLAGPQVGTIAQGTQQWAHNPSLLTVGPPPNHFGITPPALNPHNIPGVARAQSYSRPATALALGAHAPAFNPGTIRAQQVPYTAHYDRPIATSPQYYGVRPQPYRPYQSYQPYTASRPMTVPSYHSYAPPAYHSYSPPAYHSYSPPAYHSYSAPTTTYSHSYSRGGFGGGGGGFHGAGGGFHGGGGGGHGGGHR